MLDFSKGVVKKSPNKKGKRIVKTKKGYKVEFDTNKVKLYVVIDEKRYYILNNILLKGASGKMPLYSIPIANDALEDWTLRREIDAEIVFDRYELLNPIWSSVKEGSKVDGKTLDKDKFEVTEIIKV